MAKILQEDGFALLLEDGYSLLYDNGFSLTLAGINFLPYYKTNSLHRREIGQNKSNVMTFQLNILPGQPTPQEGSEIIYKNAGTYLFGGYVTKIKPDEVGEGQLFMYDVECSDYSFIFGSKIARRAYNNKTLKYIVEDLISTYVGASYGFDTSNVAVGPTIDSVTFDHISVRKCFEKLQKLTGYIWSVDYQMNLYFTTQTAIPAPANITDSSNNFSDISITYDISQVRNSVIVIGSEVGEPSASYTEQTFVGDGTTRSWQLDDRPSSVDSIKVNGVAQQFSLDVNERDTDIFVYSFAGASFQMTVAPTTLTGSDTIVIRYYPTIPIISTRQDDESIAFFAALEGGDGVKEYTIKDTSITSKASATARALQDLDEFSMPQVNAEFTTRTGLAGSAVFSPGQVLTVNLPTHGINTDSGFLIQEVNMTVVENDDQVEYSYQVRFGGRLVGVQEFLESLVVESGAEVNDAQNILTIYHQTEAEVFTDNAPTKVNITPPFKYGPAGSPQGKWNLSEWA